MQLEFFDVPSPCVGVCQSDTKGYCLGCMRTREERQEWTSFNLDDKQKVIKRCVQRKKRKDSKVKAKVVVIEEAHSPTENQQASLLDPPNKPKIDNSTDLDFGDFEL